MKRPTRAARGEQMNPTFEANWSKILRTLWPGQVVENWSRAKGHTGGSFVIDEALPSGVVVSGANIFPPRRITKADFEKVHAVWMDYATGELKRSELRDVSQNT